MDYVDCFIGHRASKTETEIKMRTYISKDNLLQMDKDVFDTKIYGCFEEQLIWSCGVSLENDVL